MQHKYFLPSTWSSSGRSPVGSFFTREEQKTVGSCCATLAGLVQSGVGMHCQTQNGVITAVFVTYSCWKFKKKQTVNWMKNWTAVSVFPIPFPPRRLVRLLCLGCPFTETKQWCSLSRPETGQWHWLTDVVEDKTACVIDVAHVLSMSTFSCSWPRPDHREGSTHDPGQIIEKVLALFVTQARS